MASLWGGEAGGGSEIIRAAAARKNHHMTYARNRQSRQILLLTVPTSPTDPNNKKRAIRGKLGGATTMQNEVIATEGLLASKGQLDVLVQVTGNGLLRFPALWFTLLMSNASLDFARLKLWSDSSEGFAGLSQVFCGSAPLSLHSRRACALHNKSLGLTSRHRGWRNQTEQCDARKAMVHEC
eukprot:6201027-Pleurochrysis_carterae.AAC.4